MSWVGWSVASAVFGAITAILAKVGVDGVDSNLAAAVRTGVVLLFTVAVVLAGSSKGGLAALTGRNWLFLALSGLATGVSWVCYFKAMNQGEASRVDPVEKMSMALVIVIAAIVLGERLTWFKGIGGFLILAGAAFIALDR